MPGKEIKPKGIRGVPIPETGHFLELRERHQRNELTKQKEL